jgi:RND superfamily putative drug exporter
VQIVQIGFVVSAGILIDTMLVRSLLVPALAVDVGPRVWWPSRLARVVGVPDEVETPAAEPARERA